MANVHATAVVEDGAKIGDGVQIGAYCWVGPEVSIGDGVVLHPHAVLTGRTEIGAGTQIFPFAVIGGAPQDLSYKGEPTGVVIGPNCIIREHVTIHRGTARGRKQTVVGPNCFLMLGTHVAHDCLLGEKVILTNNATLGGHVEVGDFAILGGLTAVQQRTRIGAHTFIGGLTGVADDIIPYATALGYRARLAGLNLVGLKRRGFGRETLQALRIAYRDIFGGEGTRVERMAALAERYAGDPAVMCLVDFVTAPGRHHLCVPREKGDRAEVFERVD